MPKTEAQKKAQKKWNEQNREYVLMLANINSQAYYERNKEARREYARQYRQKKKQQAENAEIPDVAQPGEI